MLAEELQLTCCVFMAPLCKIRWYVYGKRRSVCGDAGLSIPAACAASWQARVS